MHPPRWALSLILLAITLAYLAVGALAWGRIEGYLAHPARATAIGLTLVATLVVTNLTDFNKGSALPSSGSSWPVWTRRRRC